MPRSNEPSKVCSDLLLEILEVTAELGPGPNFLDDPGLLTTRTYLAYRKPARHSPATEFKAYRRPNRNAPHHYPALLATRSE
jgi:hypothetical protein